MRTTHQGGASGPALMAGLGGVIVLGSALGILWISGGFDSLSGLFSSLFPGTPVPGPAPALASPLSSFTFTEGRSPGQLVTVEQLRPEHVERLRGLIVPREEEAR